MKGFAWKALGGIIASLTESTDLKIWVGRVLAIINGQQRLATNQEFSFEIVSDREAMPERQVRIQNGKHALVIAGEADVTVDREAREDGFWEPHAGVVPATLVAGILEKIRGFFGRLPWDGKPDVLRVGFWTRRPAGFFGGLPYFDRDSLVEAAKRFVSFSLKAIGKPASDEFGFMVDKGTVVLGRIGEDNVFHPEDENLVRRLVQHLIYEAAPNLADYWMLLWKERGATGLYWDEDRTVCYPAGFPGNINAMEPKAAMNEETAREEFVRYIRR